MRTRQVTNINTTPFEGQNTYLHEYTQPVIERNPSEMADFFTTRTVVFTLSIVPITFYEDHSVSVVTASKGDIPFNSSLDAIRSSSVSLLWR